MADLKTHGRAFAALVTAPAAALVILAVQVGSNAARDALFLSAFPVTALPWFIALAAAVTLLAAPATGMLLARHGPRGTVPATFVLSGALFWAEAWLLGPLPRAVAVVLFLHATVLGAIALSTFWSLLNECFDPHSAKGVFSRVAGAATLGAVFGGVGAERVAAFGSPRVLLALLATGAAVCACASLAVAWTGEGVPDRDRRPTLGDGGTAPARTPYVRGLAVVAMLAALVGTLCDYVLKADVASQVVGSAPLVRFFGLFYAATGLAAFAVQAALAPAVLGRLGIAGALAVHPAAVVVAGLASLALPTPWRGILPRSADATTRRSLFRTGYELLYTPLPDSTRRSVKTTIDVGWDCAGNGAGAAIVLLLTWFMPAQDIAAVTVACIIAAGVQLLGVRRLPGGYVTALENRLRQGGAVVPRVTHYAFSHVTVTSLPADDHELEPTVRPADPLVEAFSALRSHDDGRIRAALELAKTEPALVGAAIPLLARRELVDDVATALRAHGARVAGQLADALSNPDTPQVVRRRLPLVLKSCVSRPACEALIEGLSDRDFVVRHRCCRALLEMTDHPAVLHVPRDVALAAAERELDGGEHDEHSIAHVFDLLALAIDRGTIAFARQACEAGDARARGTALAYMESTLPRALFAKLERRLAEAVAHAR